MSERKESLTASDWAMADLATTAINASGLVHSLSEVLPRIWEDIHALGLGTDAVNEHPLMRVFIVQILYLAFKPDAGLSDRSIEIYLNALEYCRKKAAGE